MGKSNIHHLMCCQKSRIRKRSWEKMDLMLFVGQLVGHSIVKVHSWMHGYNQTARADSSEWREVHIKSSSTLSQMMLNFYWTLDNGSSELINLLFLDPWVRRHFIQFTDAERVLLSLCLVLLRYQVVVVRLNKQLI